MSSSRSRWLLLVLCTVSQLARADFSASALAQRASFRGALLPAVSGLRLAQDIPPPLLPGMSREQLKEEWRALDESRPSLGGPIGMLAGGGAMAFASIYFLLYGVASLYVQSVGVASATTVGVVLLGVGAALLIGGVILAVIGGVRLGAVLRERRQIGERMDELQRQIDQVDRGDAPPPPPAPTNVYLPVPARLLIARF